MLTISVIKIGVQGPAGPQGAQGIPGSNANVTAATVLTAAQAMDATQEATMRAAIGAGRADVLNAADYGAIGNGRRIDDGAMTSGSAVLTSATAAFVTGDVGKWIRVSDAGAAGADLVTTILSRQSATQVTLAANAGGTVSAKSFVYGANDTAALQAAVDAAAASAVTRTVYVPPGVYLCNISLPNRVHLHGAGMPSTTGFDPLTPTVINDATKASTAFMAALTTAPVVQALNGAFGCHWKDFTIFAGESTQTGRGLVIGDPAVAASGYEAGLTVFERISVSGFHRGWQISRAASLVFTACEAVDNVYNFHLGEDDDLGTSGGPCDTSVFSACISGGSRSDYCFYAVGAKEIQISGGDHNLADYFFYGRNVNLVITAANCEQIASDVIRISSSSLTVATIKGLNCGGALIAALDGGNQVSMQHAAFSTTAPVYSLGVFYKTAGTETPELLPANGLIARYSSTAWTTLNRVEWTNYVYHNDRRNNGAIRRIFDEFVSKYTTPYGQLGWEVTNIGGSNSARAFAGVLLGGIEFYGTTASATNQGRFGLPTNTIWGPHPWRCAFTFQVNPSATAILRVGLYSVDSPVDSTPLNGVGIVCDRSVPHANLQFEVVTAGTSVLVDTGIPYTQLATSREYIMERNSSGVFLFVRPEFGSGFQAIYPQVKHTTAVPAALLAPAIYSAVTDANYHSVRLERFDFETFPTSP